MFSVQVEIKNNYYYNLRSYTVGQHFFLGVSNQGWPNLSQIKIGQLLLKLVV